MVDNYKKISSLSKQCMLNVKLASCAPLGFPFIEMLRKNLAHFQDSHSFDWNASVSLTFTPFLALLARVNDKNAVDLQGITNMLAKTFIEELNNKIYRQIS